MEDISINSTDAAPIPSQDNDGLTIEIQEAPILTESKDTDSPGKFVGQCKWFNDKLGYGFVTIQDGEQKGTDIFIHHSGIKPLNSNYKTLKKGEYIQFDIIDGLNGKQAVNVRGIGGGALMCDFVTTKITKFQTSMQIPIQQPPSPPRRNNLVAPPHPPPPPPSWQVVGKRSKYPYKDNVKQNNPLKYSKEGRAELKARKMAITQQLVGGVTYTRRTK